MTDIKNINIGILHNGYLKKGGEDNVAESEYKLLCTNYYNVHFLKFTNPENNIKQFFIYLTGVFNIYSFIRCCKWIKKNKIEVLHIHNWFFTASPSVFWAARFYKVPVVTTIHNYRMICPSGTLIYNDKLYLKSLQQAFSWDAVKLGVYRNSSLLTFNLAFIIWFNNLIGTWNFVKTYIILTEHSKSVFQKSHLSSLVTKFVVKPNFIPNIRLSETLPRKENFLFAGRLSNEKGIRLLLQAFEGSPYKLTVIGDGPLQNIVEDFSKANSNVTYLGFKDKETIIRELSTCSALIFPSIWFETFGLILIEAFACSTPVIASSYGSPSIIVKNGYNGLHFEKSNLRDLKNKIETWAVMPETEKQNYRDNAYKSYLKDYTPEENLKQLIKIYTTIA